MVEAMRFIGEFSWIVMQSVLILGSLFVVCTIGLIILDGCVSFYTGEFGTVSHAVQHLLGFR